MTTCNQHFYQSFLDAWFADPGIDEVLLDAKGMWAVGGGRKVYARSPFSTPSQLIDLALSLARASGVRLDPVVGAAGGTIERGGFRWHCLLPPMAQDGPLLSIRRHRFAALGLDDFSVDPDLRAELLAIWNLGAHLIVAGPTGSGKTTLVSALLKLRPPEERVFLIESVPELGDLCHGLVRLAPRAANLEQIGGFSLARLMQESLRLAPDRIVIGEVRGDEASVLLDAMRSGHGGILTTLHASHADDVVAKISSRLPTKERRWLEELTHPLAVVFVERGMPPRVNAIVWIKR